MRRLRTFFIRVGRSFHDEREDHEINEELQSLLQMHIEDNIRFGRTPEQARREALLKLGGMDQATQLCRDQRAFPLLESFFYDFRFALRSLRKSPCFSLVAILTLALGIGANTAIFTLINQVILERLPVRDAQQLVALGDSISAGVAGGIDLGGFGGYFPWDFARQLEQNPGPFQGIAAYGSFSNKLNVLEAKGVSPAEAAPLASAVLVSGNYFTVLGAQPSFGRTILPADDATPGSGAVVVVSDHFWRQSLFSDPAIVGKSITISRTPFEVVGVMPAAFRGFKQELEPTDLWIPISMQPVVLEQPSMLVPHAGLYFLHAFGRLNPQAATNQAALDETQTWLNQQVRLGVLANEGGSVAPDRQREISRISVPLIPAANGVSLIRSQYGESLKILMAVVGVVLLIACANLANSLLARGATRRREIATRLALGSSRARIVRQSLTETLILSLAGSLLGLGFAFAVTRALILFVSQGRGTIAMTPAPNLHVLFFTLSVGLVAALLFGLMPAIVFARISHRGSLNSSSRTAQGSHGRHSRLWPKTLVTSQIVMSLLLLVGAGLLLRTFRNLENQDYGFERRHLLLAQIDEKLAGYKPHQISAVHQLVLERFTEVPGVHSVALSVSPPISGGAWSSNISPDGYTPAPKENMVSVLNRVSGKYFETAGIAILAGRPISDADTASSLKVAVVSESIAKRYYPDGQAIGRNLTIGIDGVRGPWQIVGIARDTKSGNPRDTAPARMTYIPLAQVNPFLPGHPPTPGATGYKPIDLEENQDCYANTILLRTTGDPRKTIADLRTALARINPNLPVLEITTIEEQVSNLIANDELISVLTTLFSMLALLLAAIGLYGVMSYNVVERTNEIGVRIALGAQLRSVLWMIVRESLILLGIGVVLGLPLAIAATRGIRNQLFGLSALDPVTLASSIAVVSGMILSATLLPARRAMQVEPVVALRYE